MAIREHLIMVEDGLNGTEWIPLAHLPSDSCILHCRMCHFSHCKEIDCPETVLYPPMPMLDPQNLCIECHEPFAYREQDDRRVNHARMWLEDKNLPHGW